MFRARDTISIAMRLLSTTTKPSAKALLASTSGIVFTEYVAPGHEIEYLIMVSNQLGGAGVNVYGLLKTDE